MNLTNEQIEQILEGAPDGATHVEVIEDESNEYWLLDADTSLWHWHKNPKDPNRTWRIGIPELPVENIQSLSDLREILTLRKRVEGLEAQLGKTNNKCVVYDLEPAQHESAIRDHLIELGWVPPKEQGDE